YTTQEASSSPPRPPAVAREGYRGRPQFERKFLLRRGQLADFLAAAVPDRDALEAVVELVTEAAEKRRERRAERPVAAVLDLQGDAEPIGAGGAEEGFRAALRNPAGQSPHQLRIGLARPADKLGVCAHRGRDLPASFPGLEPREHECDPLERQREADDAAAVDGSLDRGGFDICGRGDFGRDLLLEWMTREPVALGLPAAGPARREHAGVLA